jgi:ribosomal protein S14
MIRQKSWILLDFYKRKKFLKYEIKRLFITSLNNKNINMIEETSLLLKMGRCKNISSINKFNNRCIKSGRYKNTNSKFNLSRFALRIKMKRNQLSLIRKN